MLPSTSRTRTRSERCACIACFVERRIGSLVDLVFISQVDEIFGTIQEVYFSVKVNDGITATSFKAADKLYINPLKLLPLERFLPGGDGGGGGGGKGKGKGKGGKGKGKGGKGKIIATHHATFGGR